MAIQTEVVIKPVDASAAADASVFCSQTVTIGNQVWMAENLAVDDGGEGVACMNGEHYYYTWAAAVRIAKAIPGWHLPTAQEWDAASLACGAKEIPCSNPNLNDYDGALILKDKLGVKLVGYRNPSSYNNVGSTANFWTATAYSATYACSRLFDTGASVVSSYDNKSNVYYSIRLVKDSTPTTPEGTVEIKEFPDKKGKQTIEEMQNILSAIAQGQAVEWFDDHNGTWRELDYNSPNFNYIHRVKPQKIATNQELAQWCAGGKGQVHCAGAANVHAFYSYQFGEDDFQVTADYEVRKWADDDWHKPTREYLGLEGT